MKYLINTVRIGHSGDALRLWHRSCTAATATAADHTAVRTFFIWRRPRVVVWGSTLHSVVNPARELAVFLPLQQSHTKRCGFLTIPVRVRALHVPIMYGRQILPILTRTFILQDLPSHQKPHHHIIRKCKVTKILSRFLPAWHFTRIYPDGDLFRQTQVIIVNVTLFASTVNYRIPQLGLVHPQTPEKQCLMYKSTPATFNQFHAPIPHFPSPEGLSFAWLFWVPVAFVRFKKDRSKSYGKPLPAWALQLAMLLRQSCHKENRSSNLFLHFL